MTRGGGRSIYLQRSCLLTTQWINIGIAQLMMVVCGANVTLRWCADDGGIWGLTVQKSIRRGEEKRITELVEKRDHRKQRLQILHFLSPLPSPAASAAETATPEWGSWATPGDTQRGVDPHGPSYYHVEPDFLK